MDCHNNLQLNSVLIWLSEFDIHAAAALAHTSRSCFCISVMCLIIISLKCVIQYQAATSIITSCLYTLQNTFLLPHDPAYLRLQSTLKCSVTQKFVLLSFKFLTEQLETVLAFIFVAKLSNPKMGRQPNQVQKYCSTKYDSQFKLILLGIPHLCPCNWRFLQRG